MNMLAISNIQTNENENAIAIANAIVMKMYESR
jgi:hypothetical protein